MNTASDEEERRSSGEFDRKSAGGERRLTILNNRIESKELFVGTRDIVIAHGAEAYHLRLTSQNKLILTK